MSDSVETVVREMRRVESNPRESHVLAAVVGSWADRLDALSGEGECCPNCGALTDLTTPQEATPRAAEAVTDEQVEAFARVYWKGDWPFKPDTEATRELMAEFRDVIKATPKALRMMANALSSRASYGRTTSFHAGTPADTKGTSDLMDSAAELLRRIADNLAAAPQPQAQDKTRPVSEWIAELRQDPEIAAGMDAARGEARSTSHPYRARRWGGG